ncbi:MAG: peptide ABC transporter substrate-binding protein [Oscillospiraceae bacterium]|nr:peptide ABC transporter substrate-binding protein [Oscillospiraceae bacterium]
MKTQKTQKKARAVFAAALMLAMLLGLGTSGCGILGSAAKGEFVAWVGSSPETLDPCMNSAADGATYLVHLFQGLFRYKWDGSGVEAGDAESYTISDDGLVWTFKLRNNIKWSDGEAVTAKDYEYSWKRVCDPEVAGPYAWDLAEFILNGVESLEGECSIDDVGVKAIDERTFEVTLSGPCPFFDQVAVFPVLYPVRQDIIEEYGENWWIKAENYISNGPYTMTSFVLDEIMTFEINENYYDKNKIKAATISWKFYQEDTQALTAFRAGELDIGNGCPPVEIPALAEEGVLASRPLLGTYYLSYNCERAPFDNALVRKALTLAIDRDYIATTVMQGTFMPATSMVGSGFGDVDQAKDFREMGGEYISLDYAANIELAKAALAEAGYPDGVGFPTIEYMYNPSSTHQSVAEVIAKMWEEVLGIKTELVSQEWNVFLETRRVGNYQVARDGWLSDWNDASSMLGLFTSNSGNNNSQYKNAQFDAYMAEAGSTNDRAKRIAAMHNAEEILMNDWPCGPIMLYAQNYIVSKDLKNWHENALGYTFLHLAQK